MGAFSPVHWLILLLFFSAFYPALMFLIRGRLWMAMAPLMCVPVLGWIALWIVFLVTRRPTAATS